MDPEQVVDTFSRDVSCIHIAWLSVGADASGKVREGAGKTLQTAVATNNPNRTIDSVAREQPLTCRDNN